MRRRYRDCTRPDGICARCKRAQAGVDCHGRPITRIETLRRIAGIEQGQLAEAVGISSRQLCRVETDPAVLDTLSLKNIRGIAAALSVDVEMLIDGGTAAMKKTFMFEDLEGALEIRNAIPDDHGNICTRFTWGAIEEFPTFRSLEQAEKFVSDPDAIADLIDQAAHVPDEFED